MWDGTLATATAYTRGVYDPHLVGLIVDEEIHCSCKIDGTVDLDCVDVGCLGGREGREQYSLHPCPIQMCLICQESPEVATTRESVCTGVYPGGGT